MTFNYRVFREEVKAGLNDIEVVLTIRTTYYNEDGTLRAYADTPAYAVGSGEILEHAMLELLSSVNHIQEALSKPILTEADFHE